MNNLIQNVLKFTIRDEVCVKPVKNKCSCAVSPLSYESKGSISVLLHVLTSFKHCPYAISGICSLTPE